MRTLVVRRLAAFALVLGCQSCGGATGSFQLDGYHHEEYPYRVSATTGGQGSLLGEKWQIDNYQRDKKGALIARKKGDRYEGWLRFDINDDGEMETQLKYPRFDLLFTHRHSDAEIWLSNIPLSGKNAEKDLRVLLERYVEGISGTGSVVVISISEREKAAVSDKRYATRIIEVQKVRVDGVDGLAATIEVANVDQLQLSPDSRWARSRIVLLRPGFRYTLGPSTGGVTRHSWPLLFAAGYTNSIADFSASAGEFERFLGNIDFLTDEEIVAKSSGAMLDCVGKTAMDLEVQIDGAGLVVRIPLSGPPCLRRLLSNLKFGAQGQPRTFKTAVTRRSAAEMGPKGYEALEVLVAAEEPTIPTAQQLSSTPNDPI